MGRFERDVLANGVRVLTAPMPEAQSIACFLGFAAGSRYETRDTRGTAHFVEHMLFKGTEHRPTGRDLAAEVDAIGGEINAFTGKEYTVFFVRCAPPHLDVALDLLVDMARHSTFPVAEVEREKGVIIEEMNTYHHSPRDCVGENFDALLYGDRPLGWAIIGTRETVEDADRARLVEYRRQWYTASRLVVGVAGAIDGPMRDRVEQLLGDLEPGDGGFQPAVVDSGPRVVIEERVSDQAEIALGAPSFRLDHPDEYVGAVIAALLGGGMSSRLFTELRDQRGLGYRVTTVHQQYSDAGSIWAQAGVAAEKIDEAIAATVREFRGLTAEPVPANELEKARNLAKGQFVVETETPQGLMNHAITRELSSGRTPDPSVVLARLESVTADDVQRVARELFGPDALRLALIGPFDDPGRFEGVLLGDLGEAHGVRPDPIASRVLTTILFTDIVASTERARALGDAGWARLLQQHHESVRRQLRRFAGEEIDTAGDGFLALFDAPARAIRCALAICVALQPLELELRAGVHTGEVERPGGGAPRGIAVHVGARVAANAAPGETLVTATTRELVAGSGLEFEDRGEVELKGLDEARHVYAAMN